MGNYLESRGYTVRIRLNRRDKVYFEGESISGKVKFSNTSKHEQRLAGVYLAIRCKVIYSKLLEDVNNRMMRKQEYRSMLYEKKSILSEEFTLPCGVTEIPFSHIISGQLPPSVSHSGSAEVRYDLQISIGLSRSLYIANIKVASTPITVVPKVEQIGCDERLSGSGQQSDVGYCKRQRRSSFVDSVVWRYRQADNSRQVDEIDKYICELDTPQSSVGVQQMIPYTVRLRLIDNTPMPSSKSLLLKVKLIQCLTVFSNLYRKTMISHVLRVSIADDRPTAKDVWKCPPLYEHSAQFCLPKCTTSPSYSIGNHDRLSVSYVIECTLRALDDGGEDHKIKHQTVSETLGSPGIPTIGNPSVSEQKDRHRAVSDEIRVVACSPVLLHNVEAIYRHPGKC